MLRYVHASEAIGCQGHGPDVGAVNRLREKAAAGALRGARSAPVPAESEELGHGLHIRKGLPALEEVLLQVVREVWVSRDQAIPQLTAMQGPLTW